ncbi:hypothetical protein N0V93_005636 [Gnomoniopsis smithogilvyi]|uniref:C2H2-type domain-containing protein n=1 Tax=Gnomoniopsis smithogilvyi TaxID=1191159 RepID=A0A9W9CYB7_9PEZI|nr:hypothetical protein N0V93_005636 [Gnomoniopsis smithogilvyi]
MKRSRDSDSEDDTAGYGKDAVLVPVSKILNIDEETESKPGASAIQCSLPGHAKGMSFTYYHDYERHYIQVHTNRCLECGKNFPTAHIMGLHIQERHDALAEMKREQGACTYECFVEACEDKFKSYQQRKEHLIRDHAYPRNYFFAVTKFGIDRRQSMLVENSRGKHSHAKDSLAETKSPQKHGIKAADQSCQSARSKEVLMADTGTTDVVQQDAAEDVPMGETREATGQRPTGNLAVGEARESSDLTAPDRHASQDSAAVDAEIDSITSAMSSLKFVPRVIRLGPKQQVRR